MCRAWDTRQIGYLPCAMDRGTRQRTYFAMRRAWDTRQIGYLPCAMDLSPPQFPQTNIPARAATPTPVSDFTTF